MVAAIYFWRTRSLSQLDWSEGWRPPQRRICIHQINQMNSRNGFAMMTAPQISFQLLLLLLLLLLFNLLIQQKQTVHASLSQFIVSLMLLFFFVFALMYIL